MAKVCRISEVSPSGYYEWMICSMNRTGTPYGNDCAETFFNTIKLEMIYQEHVKTRAQAQTAIFEYIKIYYNRQRRKCGNRQYPAL